MRLRLIFLVLPLLLCAFVLHTLLSTCHLQAATNIRTLESLTLPPSFWKKESRKPLFDFLPTYKLTCTPPFLQTNSSNVFAYATIKPAKPKNLEASTDLLWISSYSPPFKLSNKTRYAPLDHVRINAFKKEPVNRVYPLSQIITQNATVQHSTGPSLKGSANTNFITSKYWYQIDGLNYRFAQPISPEYANELPDILIRLHKEYRGFTGPKKGEKSDCITLGQVGQFKRWYRSDALVEMAQQIVAYFNDLGLIGISVEVDPTQIDSKGDDLRTNDKELTFVIYTGYLSHIQTVALNTVNKCEDGINLSKYSSLIENFPLHLAYDGCSIDGGSLFNCDLVSDYLYRINRYPGRRINAEITGVTPDGGIDVNLVIAEDKPWFVYANISNTGSEATGHWIDRFGFVDYQLTRHDDTFSIEYATAHFKAMHSLMGYYEAPVWGVPRTRIRVDGMRSTFALYSQDLQVNFDTTQDRFGPSVIVNVYQHRNLFIDTTLGVYWFRVSALNNLFTTYTTENFFLPTVGLVLEKCGDSYSIQSAISYEKNFSGVAHTNANDLANLGRINPSVNWSLLEASFNGTAYLNPKLFDHNHEFALLFSGQYAFGNRLIPQKEGILGGLYSVRGYDQSVTVGDTVFFGQLEYRYHFPKSCCVPTVECPHPYVRPWDFMLRGFFDAGRAIYTRHETYEVDYTLAGVGGGLEVMYRKNIRLRADAGIALLTVEQNKAGTGRFYFSATLMF
ncbi:MAG: ShlB/FhaC/HecB family hemolysin secretion/activation protein [Parachlamydiales bacterium]|nr:ShlB/FhaC/HecB family hemolysin secretion/activation protein [Parachlamydiales bacterium]